MPNKEPVNDLSDILEQLKLDIDSGKMKFNENLKMVAFIESKQGIQWFPSDKTRNIECIKCGIKADYYCYLNNQKTFSCNSCLWSFKKN